MANWITKPWIERALGAEDQKKLPKIAKAQILQVGCGCELVLIQNL